MRENPIPSNRNDHSVAVYTLEVSLSSGPIQESFYDENPVVSRTIQIRGDQTLEDLHDIIFTAFDREDDSMYEFKFGKETHDPKSTVSVLPSGVLGKTDEGSVLAKNVIRTRIDSLGLKRNETFSYWFDFEENWMHDIRVTDIETGTPYGKFPRITSRTGESPAQYPDWESEDEVYAEDMDWDVAY